MNAIVAVLCIVIVLIFLIVLLTQTGKTKTKQLPTAADAAVSEEVTTQAPTEAPTEPESLLTYPMVSSAVYPLTAQNITSEYAILLDVNNNEILAERNADTRFYPASMTKIMTLLVAAEQIKDMNDTFTMTYDIIAPLIEADASRAGFEEGEEVTITDLLYGIALPSGADATTAIAIYLCGSEEAFVTLMNDKVEELGLKNTHFCNASGLHDENHYTTATDMALLMSYVMENPICKEILGTYQYTTSQTEQHPEGILLTSTMYSRMYGDEVEGMTITGGKTGYTDEAGHCLVSYAEDEKGNSYVTVVAKDTTYWRAIFDTFAIYGLVNNGYPMPTDLMAEEATEESDDEYAVAGNSGE
jgi:D-alanyl-D-alanine carboxypeptidase (penicillin-binding protein 5/6)